MKNTTIYAYRSTAFDGEIYVKVAHPSPSAQYEITLFKDSIAIQSATGKVAAFHNKDASSYHAVVNVTEDN